MKTLKTPEQMLNIIDRFVLEENTLDINHTVPDEKIIDAAKKWITDVFMVDMVTPTMLLRCDRVIFEWFCRSESEEYNFDQLIVEVYEKEISVYRYVCGKGNLGDWACRVATAAIPCRYGLDKRRKIQK